MDIQTNQDVKSIIQAALPAWTVEDRGFEPRFDIKVSKKKKCFFLLTRKD